MSNLIPTVITDVNGKVTTVHKRAVAEVMRNRKIPSPDTVASPKMITRQAMKDFEAAGVKVLDTTHGNKNLFHLAKRYPETLKELLVRVQQAGVRERTVWSYLITATDLHNGGRSVYDLTPMKYRMWFSLLPATLDLNPSTGPDSSFAAANYTVQQVSGLASILEASERKQGRHADDDGYRRVKAIMTVIAVDKVARAGSGSFVDRDDDVEFIEHNMEAIEPLIPELMKRGNSDRGFIQELIDSSTKALNEGIL